MLHHAQKTPWKAGSRHGRRVRLPGERSGEPLGGTTRGLKDPALVFGHGEKSPRGGR